MTGTSGFRGRMEDERFLTGAGRYLDDHDLPGQAIAAFFRSPVAHGRIRAVHTEAARAVPGVIAVLTGEDLRECGYGHIPVLPQSNADGTPHTAPPWPPLAVDRVRFVGESVALVIAETRAAAEDGRDAIDADIEDLAVSARPGMPVETPVWPEAPDNVALDFESGDAAAVDTAFARAAHVAEIRLDSQRVAPVPMETRAVLARWEADREVFHLTAGSQGAAGLSREVASILGVAPETVHVVSPDTGGGFGAKAHAYPDYAALLHASRAVDRPVKWTPTRSEAFMTDSHGRDSDLWGALALDENGRFLGLRVRSTVNIGAYQTSVTTFTATWNMVNSLAGVYRTPALHAAIRCVYTNTNPVAPYRGAGRPEANLILEALVDRAAEVTGIDRIALRRRNMVPADAMPHVAANGMEYCSGDFPAVLDRALELADAEGFAARRDEAAAAGRLRGLGIACYLEIAGVVPVETARLDLDAEGRVMLSSGLHANGQGHETVFRTLVARRLEIPVEATGLADADSARVPDGIGSFASRSAMVGSAAALHACDRLVDLLRDKAATLLQAGPAELDYGQGALRHRRTGQRLTLAQIARQAGPVRAEAQADVPPTFPNGCHVAEIEIDPETGALRVVGFTAVDDVGTRLDPVIVEGQLHGGIAQGLGQFLMEHVAHDDETAQLLSGSFMDYAIPRADCLPALRTDHVDRPSPNNPLGVKGVGEAGTSGSLAAAYNALIDALGRAGVREFTLPASPSNVWEALRSARGTGP